jgi:hypothetical protein
MNDQLFTELPAAGAWRLKGAYDGHEVVHFAPGDQGIVLRGFTVGVEDGMAWGIHYIIDLTDDWHVRHASISDHLGTRLELRTDGNGSWTVGGQHRAELDGCLDVDLEASVVTNTIPLHRLALAVEQQGESNAVYVRTVDLATERLDQTYRRLADAGDEIVFEYRSPRFGYHDTLRFGTDGLALEYPGIGERVRLKE